MTVEEKVKYFVEKENATYFDFVEDTINDKNLREKYNKRDEYEKYMLYCASACGLVTKNRKKQLKLNLSKLSERVKSKQERTKGIRSFLDNGDGESVERKELIFNMHDPDDGSSELLQDIYKKLWPNLTRQEFMLKGDKIQSDTMTSVHQRFNDLMEYVESKMTDDMKIDGMEVEAIRKDWGKKQNYSMRLLLELYGRNKEQFKEIMESNEKEKLIKFMKLHHTIGNYCPVPVNFNAARSGNFASHDYWDLTLMKIQEYYLNPEDGLRILQKELLHGEGNAWACKKWLDYFGSGLAGWKTFVKANYMQDFVYTEQAEWNPKPFFKGHGWHEEQGERCGFENKKGKFDENFIEKYDEFLTNVCEMIEKRGERLVEALRCPVST